MRFKYYIRGFGLGIIFTTIILILAFALHGGMTNEQIKKEALKLGMTEVSSADNTINNSDSESQKEPAPTQESESTQSPETSQTPEPTQEPDSTPETETSSEPEPTPEPTPEPVVEPENVRFVVENGDTCRMVAEKLYQNGLIDDVEAFRTYMNSHQYSNSLHTGTYSIPRGSSYEEIAKILIPKDRW